MYSANTNVNQKKSAKISVCPYKWTEIMKHLTVKQKCIFVTLDIGCQSGCKCNNHTVSRGILSFTRKKNTFDKI